MRTTARICVLLLCFDMVKEDAKSEHVGLSQNWLSTCALKGAFTNEIAVLSPVRPGGKLTTVFKPESPVFVGEMNLHFDADRLLISMPNAQQRWHVWELKTDGTGLRQVTPDEKELDFCDACYLPDDRIIFTSTAPIQGVPCISGGSPVANTSFTPAPANLSRCSARAITA